MKWIELSVFTTQAGLEPVSGAFVSLGIDELQICDGRSAVESFLEDTAAYWDYADLDKLVPDDRPCVKAFFADVEETAAQREAVCAAIERLKNTDAGVELGSLEIRQARIDDEDWANNWKAYYKPLPIGPRLLVTPSWENPPADGRVKLMLDPGMAFGTGLHHTTRMCLELLQEELQQGAQVLDLGCGSGILSIAALLLGAAHANAIDIDPTAQVTALENAQRNQISKEQYTVYAGDVLTDPDMQAKLAGQYDLVLVNIVADVIIGLSPVLPGYCKPEGGVILSGIIDERLQDVKNALEQAGLVVCKERLSGGWAALLARPRGEDQA